MSVSEDSSSESFGPNRGKKDAVELRILTNNLMQIDSARRNRNHPERVAEDKECGDGENELYYTPEEQK